MVHHVRATREGRIGYITSSGLTLAEKHHGCALPSTWALWRWVKISYAPVGLPVESEKSIIVQVLDTGPWNTHDDGYVRYGLRPQAEGGTDMTNRKTNGAGIDLFDATARYLDIGDGGQVIWEFVPPPAAGFDETGKIL